jgi:hypothetical protein
MWQQRRQQVQLSRSGVMLMLMLMQQLVRFRLFDASSAVRHCTSPQNSQSVDRSPIGLWLEESRGLFSP